MRLSWSGKLFAAAVGAKVVAEGLRYVAGMIPDSPETVTRLSVCCPACKTRYNVSGPGLYTCSECTVDFTVR